MENFIFCAVGYKLKRWNHLAAFQNTLVFAEIVGETPLNSVLK